MPTPRVGGAVSDSPSTDCDAPTVISKPKTHIVPADATESLDLDALEPAGASHAESRFPQIDGYRIRRILGRGGMGVVYEAVQLDLSRPVALKLLPAFVSGAHREMLTRFRREAAAAARLHHTHIIPIYHYGESPAGAFYTMELIDGLPLDRVVRRLAPLDVHAVTSVELADVLSATEDPEATPPSAAVDARGRSEPLAGSAGAARATARAKSGGSTSSGTTGSKGREYYRHVARWMADAADALHYAHTQGIIHRDVKPSNLMLARDGRIMICDFGLAKADGDHSVTQTGALVGTYRYLSPEQIGAKRITVDARTDIYSLGATMYELLTFAPVFPAVQQSELLSQILFKEPIPPKRLVPTVPTDLQTICLKTLEKSPGARYQSAREFADDLRAYLDDNPIRARRYTIRRHVAKFVSRHRVESIAAAIILVVAVVAGIVVRSYYNQWLDARNKARDEQRLATLKDGVRAWQSGDHAAAKAAFNRVLADFPNDYAALVNLANTHKDAYWRECDPAELQQAETLLRQAVATSPTRADGLNGLGVALQADGEYDRAIEQFNLALERDPNFFAPYVNLGIAYACKRDLDTALDKAEEGVARAPTGSAKMPLRILAAVRLQTRHPDVANTLALARQVAQGREPGVQVLSAIHELRAGTPDSNGRALEYAISARSLAEQAGTSKGCPVNQTRARAARVLAQARLANGDFAEAAAAAEDALAARDLPAVAHLLHALADVQLGRIDEARQRLAAADAAWPEWASRDEDTVVNDGDSLWFDSPAELKQLREQVVNALESAGTSP